MKSEFTSEDVLNAFAVERTHDRATLERYLHQFPQYAVELALLSRELSRGDVDTGELSDRDRAAIAEAWIQYSSSPSFRVVDIFNSLSVPQRRELASSLGIPLQIVTAFRERKVIVSSIPRRFLARMATALGRTSDQVIAALSLPLETCCVRSHKSDEKPLATGPATFEKLLIDAQVPKDKLAELMADDDYH
jgi:hypothetical protein